MAFDLEWEPEEEEEEVMISESDGSEEESAPSAMSPGSPMDIDADNPEGYVVRLDRSVLEHVAVPGPDQAAESMAYAYLRLGRVTNNLLAELFSLLPAKAQSRNTRESQGCSFTVGAYVYGGVCGLHRNTNAYPWTCMLLSAVLKSVDETARFTTLVMAKDTINDVHVDPNNSPDVPNVVLALSRFQGGAIWTYHPQGSDVREGIGRGQLLELKEGAAVRFDATQQHFTTAFSGTRLVLIAYHVKCSWKLDVPCTLKLQMLGFSLRDVNPAISDPYLRAGT